jgi:hypothetical protein
VGANLDTRTYSDKLGQRGIADQWAIDVENSRYQDGISYSGQIGMLGPNISKWYDHNFKSEAEAENWLSENQDKWDPAIAVSFTQQVRTKEYVAKYDAGRKKLEAELDKQIVKFTDIVKRFADKFVTIKAQYCTCKKCGSKLNHDYLKPSIPTNFLLKFKWDVSKYTGVACPVCHEPMYAEVAYSRIKGAYKKVQKALDDYNNFEVEPMVNNAEKGWVVGGWCSS